MAQEPIRTRGGSVRIVDSRNFPASRPSRRRWSRSSRAACASCTGTRTATSGSTTSRARAAWACSPSGEARTFDYQAGDVGYVPFAMGHYVENTGDTPLRFLEMFKSSYYADVSLNQWMALTPPELVQGTLKLDGSVMSALRRGPAPVVPV